MDCDPLVRVHAQALLTSGPNTMFLTADLREPQTILHDAAVREFIDFGRPVGLLLFAILHHINDDEDPAGIGTCSILAWYHCPSGGPTCRAAASGTRPTTASSAASPADPDAALPAPRQR